METSEVTVDERVPRLRLIGRILGQAEEPLRVVIPRMGLEVGVLIVRARLHRPPFAVQDVLVGIDELRGSGDGRPVHGVGGHCSILVGTSRPVISPGVATTKAWHKRSYGLGPLEAMA